MIIATPLGEKLEGLPSAQKLSNASSTIEAQVDGMESYNARNESGVAATRCSCTRCHACSTCDNLHARTDDILDVKSRCCQVFAEPLDQACGGAALHRKFTELRNILQKRDVSCTALP